ncbi:class I SAM-dependent methyltransferase [Microvirga rosea]|uniref:class I SAM-dependent methyltransferase n=1 Tax=Microvirga rosea TaxID=2715425 RepID=UPI001D0B7A3B|nr:class I SAM-dependent methyltransferase [Microvirga rosea]MCB8821695.1 class I SAM-dependent methyltransferase [Microvirga rosea]
MSEHAAPDEPIGLKAYSSFADRYSALAPTKPHNGLYERPATMALLGEVRGMRILDAACGPGIGSALMTEQGAIVHGFDVTPKMVELARERCAGSSAEFRIADLAKPLDWLGDALFDKVLCALALDYVMELGPVLREFHRVARAGGTLVFSMAHPMSDWMNEDIRGTGTYYERSRFGMYWSGFGEPAPYVEAYRRPLAEILNALTEAGWTLDRVVEPRPLPEMKAVSERIYNQLAKTPQFICIRAKR